jgi:hypothetical protein
MIEIDHDPERSPCGIHLYPHPQAHCIACNRRGLDPATLEACRAAGERMGPDGRSSPAARERAQERGQARAAADPRWGQTWTPTAIGARD